MSLRGSPKGLTWQSQLTIKHEIATSGFALLAMATNNEHPADYVCGMFV